jgi:hypothetical protein
MATEFDVANRGTTTDSIFDHRVRAKVRNEWVHQRSKPFRRTTQTNPADSKSPKKIKSFQVRKWANHAWKNSTSFLVKRMEEAMIITDKFVFAHLPRSGGTFVSGHLEIFSIGARNRLSLVAHASPREYLNPVLVRSSWILRNMVLSRVARDAATALISWVTENGRSVSQVPLETP